MISTILIQTTFRLDLEAVMEIKLRENICNQVTIYNQKKHLMIYMWYLDEK